MNNIGNNLGKEITVWTRTNDNCMLCDKPIKVDTKSVGYKRKNGEIAFQSEDAAVSYARNKVLKALNCENPHEYNVEIKGTSVIKEEDGDIDGFFRDLNSPIEIGVHGHPDTYKRGCTTAPSGPDFWCLADFKNQKKEIVFNSNGEHYIIEKVPNFKYDSKAVAAGCSEFELDMIRHYFDDKPQKIKEKLELAIQNNDEKTIDELIQTYMPALPQDLSKEMTELSHTFWLKNADKYGIKAETNFSNFKDLSV